MLAGLSSTLQDNSTRIQHIDDKMTEYHTAHNDLGHSFTEQDDLLWLKSKVADLEDRSRRNNIKIQGSRNRFPHKTSTVTLKIS